MQLPVLENIKQKFSETWENLIQKSNEDEIADVGRERIVVFAVSLILAVCLWFMVNLSRDYNLNVDLPIVAVGMPDDRALAQELPKSATVSITGEGWKLISIYNNPPSVNLNVTGSEINLYDQVQRQMNAISEVNVQKVQPLMLTLNLEERVSKTVPVKPVVDISFERQYGFIGDPTVDPDSVRISGAVSLVKGITAWPTDSLTLSEVSADISERVTLKRSELISLSQSEVRINGTVDQFTEGETTIDLETRNLPEGRRISYSPSSITVTFDVPVDEYADIKNEELFEAYLTYDQIQEDTTGYVSPRVEKLSDNEYVKIRSFQPERVAYFMVLDD
ncbi:CdaR family protein [Fodinibius sediminis]|uniref:YbbR domain-containing protein n=1 Tax=Fodinibius sediminis TaxID=1214077 RepID=A0A521CPY2_9BACT|nr:CdaR family protein [Fodinibius sediminis]SMO60720.1 YbbR domain-containing protein [Fodinibius sediminis]